MAGACGACGGSPYRIRVKKRRPVKGAFMMNRRGCFCMYAGPVYAAPGKRVNLPRPTFRICGFFFPVLENHT